MCIENQIINELYISFYNKLLMALARLANVDYPKNDKLSDIIDVGKKDAELGYFFEWLEEDGIAKLNGLNSWKAMPQSKEFYANLKYETFLLEESFSMEEFDCVCEIIAKSIETLYEIYDCSEKEIAEFEEYNVSNYCGFDFSSLTFVDGLFYFMEECA